MKRKLSISIDEETCDKIELCLSEGRFRNKSHLFEYAITRFIENKE